MKDQDKSKAQLLEELAETRRRLAALESVQAEQRQVDQQQIDDTARGEEPQSRASHETSPGASRERAIQANEDRCRFIVEAIPQPVWRTNAKGQAIEFNRSWYEYTGQTPEEAQGAGWLKALHPDDIARTAQRARAAADAEAIFETEYRLRRGADGSYRWHLARSVPIRDEHGRLLGRFGSATDIHEQKLVHEELERKVKQRTAELEKANDYLDLFRRFAEASGQGFGMGDLDGRILYVNPTMCRLIGEDQPEDAVGKYFSAYYPDGYEERRKQEILPAMEREGSWKGEQAILSRQEKLIPTLHNAFLLRDETGKAFRRAVVVTDITEYKQAEEALRESEERYRTLVDACPDAVVMTDLEGQILFASRQTWPLLGLSADVALIGRSALDFVVPGDRERLAANASDLVEAGVRRNTEYKAIRPDGNEVPVDVSSVFLRDGQGKQKAMMAVIRDITARRQAEEALGRERQTLRYMLRASDHERQVIAYEIHDGLAQQLAAAIMHFETCGNIVKQQSGKATTAHDVGVHLLRQAHAEARRLISGVRPPILDESGITAAIAHLVHEQREAAHREIEFVGRVSFDRLPTILENSTYRIAQEALANACNHSRSEKIRVSLVQENDRLRLEVQDWGVGFDPKTVEADRFGLESIRERARLLGGQVVLESRQGEGTLVRVVLPLMLSDTGIGSPVDG